MKYQKSHIIWNRHNPDDRIEREYNGRGKNKFVIHHKDENHDNNNIKNLEKMTFKKHSILHYKNNPQVGITIEMKNKGFTGRKHTEESKRKTSKSLLGRKHTEETKRKIGLKHKGKIMSKEARGKMSLAKKGKKYIKGDNGRFISSKN